MCDALTNKGQRCKKPDTWTIPNTLATNPYRAGRDVHLCAQHHSIYGKLKSASKRLPIIEGGFLGAYNKYHYGNAVIDVPTVDWDKVTELKCPSFWFD